MTVKELLEDLKYVKDKSKEVMFHYDSDEEYSIEILNESKNKYILMIKDDN